MAPLFVSSQPKEMVIARITVYEEIREEVPDGEWALEGVSELLISCQRHRPNS